jgi:hypothetical protein
MIKVYIETSVHAECVATIQDEWVYMALLPSLEKLALEWGGILTESVVDDTPSLDQIKDMSINIVDRMVEEGLIKNCTDTDDEDEFVAQDIIREFLCKEFKIKNI